METRDVINYEELYSFSDDGKMYDKLNQVFLHPYLNSQSGTIYYRLIFNPDDKPKPFAISTGLRQYFGIYGDANKRIIKSITRQYNLYEIVSTRTKINTAEAPLSDRFYNNRLVFIRLCMGKTKKNVCDELVIAIDQYSRYEEGIQRPNNTMIKRLCDYFGVELNFFTDNQREGLYHLKFEENTIKLRV